MLDVVEHRPGPELFVAVVVVVVCFHSFFPKLCVFPCALGITGTETYLLKRALSPDRVPGWVNTYDDTGCSKTSAGLIGSTVIFGFGPTHVRRVQPEFSFRINSSASQRPCILVIFSLFYSS